MPDPFLEAVNKYNLCTWYLLSFLGLNIDTFGASNFIDSYVVRDAGQPLLAVQIADANLCSYHMYADCWWYHKQDGKDYFIFMIPEEYYIDYYLFLEGKYTQMGDEAKELIRVMTGLRYKEWFNGMETTDVILRALDKDDQPLRDKWHEVLGHVNGKGQEMELPEELLSIPAERSFIKLDI